MKYHHIMLGASVVLGLLGLSFILNGHWLFSFYGIDLSVPSEPQLVVTRWPNPMMVGMGFMRVLGAMLIGLGVFAWLLRHVADANVQSSICTGFFTINLLAFFAVLLQHVQIGLIVPPLPTSSAKLLAVLFLFMSLGFGYVRFVKLNVR